MLIHFECYILATVLMVYGKCRQVLHHPQFEDFGYFVVALKVV